MTEQATPSASFRLTRRRLMIASAAGATLIGNRKASAAPPELKSRIQTAFKALEDSCDRSLAMVGYTTTVNDLLGKQVKPFVDILKAGFAQNGGQLEPNERKLVEDLIAELETAKQKSGKNIYYRDFFTESPEAWGGANADKIIAAMVAGNGLFTQPQLRHQSDSDGTRYQTKCILDGWKPTPDTKASGFLELCGGQTVVDAFTQFHTAEKGERWIDDYLFQWLVKNNIAWSSNFAFVRGEQKIAVAAPNCVTTSNACTAFNPADGYFCVTGHPGKSCKLDQNGQPCLGTDYCVPPSGP